MLALSAIYTVLTQSESLLKEDLIAYYEADEEVVAVSHSSSEDSTDLDAQEESK